MFFTDAVFLFYFFPAAMVAHRLALGRYCGGTFSAPARIVLFLATLVFYGWSHHWWLLPFLGSVLLDYAWATMLLRSRTPQLRRALVSLSVLQNLALLAYFKYSSSIALPVGISFYTFESLSFVIDVYRGKIKELGFSSFLGFIGMFPRFVAGPITRYSDIARQFQNYGGMELEKGLTLFFRGLFLKVVFADHFAIFTPYAFEPLLAQSRLAVCVGVSAYAMQIYFDFSGYSLMAIGLGQCLGFSFPGNFDRPYLATSLTDYWRRWHQSLSFWLRDYVYISLGGNRHGRVRTAVNVFITMLLGGMWHGPGWTFIAWGCWHGLFLCLEKFAPGGVFKGGMTSRIKVLGVAWLGWVLFRANTLRQAAGIYNVLLFGGSVSLQPELLKGHVVGLLAAAAGIIYCFFMENCFASSRAFAAVLGFVALIFLFSSQQIQFIYFRF
ncbi:MAG: MBOAT family protein [Deltaproteobacteria bacterium]|nr:MBOAT family protein [Deltaproteobacteria bacterium]